MGDDGKPYLRSLDEDGDQMYLRMMIGRIDGRWQIVNVLWEMKPRG